MHLMKSTWTKIILILLLAFVLLGGLASCTVRGCSSADVGRFSGVHPTSSPLAASNEANASGGPRWTIDPTTVENIEIYWAAGSVNLVLGDEDAIVVEQEQKTRGGTPETEVYVEDKTLILSYGNLSGLVGCTSLSGAKTLTVALPPSLADSLGTVYLAAATGSYDATGIGCQNLELDVASGKVIMRDIQAQRFQLGLASGQVSVSGSVESLVDLDIASGNAELRLNEGPKRLAASLASGTVVLGLPAESGYRASVDKLSGSFESDLPYSVADGIYESGQGVTVMEVDMSSGRFRVEAI